MNRNIRYLRRIKNLGRVLRSSQDVGVNSIFPLLVVAISITGCSHIEPRVGIREPKPVVVGKQQTLAPAMEGAIFQAASFRPLFEDQRARVPGDIITITINEKTSASRKSASSAEKTNDVSASIPTVQGLPGKFLAGANLAANSSNTFAGKGETANDNTFTGTITVMVSEVLSNGNMVVVGEKQVGINHNVEIIRFSGIVSPVTLQPGNIVDSARVADARLEYSGKGYIDEAQRMGWLSRFFMTFLPF